MSMTGRFPATSVVALALVLAASGARGQDWFHRTAGAGPYFRAGLGGAIFEDGVLTEFGGPAGNSVDYSAGFASQAAVGYAFNQYFAAEIDLGFASAEIDSVPGFFLNDTFLYNAPFLANVVLSCPIRRTIVVPYIGGGAGGSVTGFDTDGFGNGAVAVFGSDSDVVFAWQAFAGVLFELNEQMSVGVSYRYLRTEDSSFSYPPAFPGAGPDLVLGFEGVRTHSFFVTFRAKF
jgi:opacity protein-like surface antigen